MNIGIWMKTGRQQLAGLTPCFFQSSWVARVRFSASFLYFSLRIYISGWSACIFCDDKACRRLIGNIAPRTSTVSRMIAIP